MKLIKKDFLALIFIALPFLYLLQIFSTLPNEVPLHWNINGEVDDMGSKMVLFIIPAALTLAIYLLLIFAVKVDPKGNIEENSKKHQTLKIAITGLISALSIYILYTVQENDQVNLNYLFAIIGIFYVVLGNYMKTIKPNYFLGIRTPWTLESDEVWIATHRTGSKLWFIGGLLVILSSLILNSSLNFRVFIIITLVITLIPIVQSYQLHKKI